MSRRLKQLRGALLVIVVSIAIVGWLLWREFHQLQLDESLLAAIKRNDTITALSLLRSHANPNTRYRDEPPPILWQFLMMRWRQMHVKKIVPKRPGHTALTLAVEKNNTAIVDVEALIAAGARDVGETLFIEEGPELVETHATLLMVAARQKNPAIIRALVRSGSNVNARDELKETALFYCRNGLVVQALADCGADLNAKTILVGRRLISAYAARNAPCAAR